MDALLVLLAMKSPLELNSIQIEIVIAIRIRIEQREARVLRAGLHFDGEDDHAASRGDAASMLLSGSSCTSAALATAGIRPLAIALKVPL